MTQTDLFPTTEDAPTARPPQPEVMRPNPNAIAEEWDYDGYCAPHNTSSDAFETFTLGVFQWLPKASRKGLKRGKVVERIKGTRHNPSLAYDKAERRIAELNQAA